MSNPFNQQVVTAADAVVPEQDVVFGFQPLPTNFYSAKIVNAYVQKSESSKAIGLRVELLIAQEGKEPRKYVETLWVSNKNGENFYVNKNTGQKITLPGFNVANALAYLAANKSLGELVSEQKIIQVKDRATGATVNNGVDAFPELFNKEIGVLITHEIVNKQVKGNDGKYHPINEPDAQNTIEHFLRSDGSSFTEIQNNSNFQDFCKEWLKVNQGRVVNKMKAVAGSPAGAPAGVGAGGVAGGGLFSKPGA